MPKHWRISLAFTAAVTFVPNDTHTAWYSIPEYACDLVTSDQDQWRCDEEPVAWRYHEVPKSYSQAATPP
jgi:hypothetical protein